MLKIGDCYRSPCGKSLAMVISNDALLVVTPALRIYKASRSAWEPIETVSRSEFMAVYRHTLRWLDQFLPKGEELVGAENQEGALAPDSTMAAISDRCAALESRVAGMESRVAGIELTLAMKVGEIGK